MTALDSHRVSLTSLNAIAGGNSDPATAELLRQANKSRQLVRLRALLDRTRQLELSPSLDDAWSLLVDAQQRDEEAADRVITHPRTGLWVANALRRLAKGTGATDEPPLWADLGYLHQLAAAAAIRAGLDFRSRVPVWRGRVMFPTLGLAELISRREWDRAEVHSEHGQILVHGPVGTVQLPANRAGDGAGWLPLRTVHVDDFELCIDDIDPYREYSGPVPPDRLSFHDLAQWTDRLQETWRLLTEHHPATADELATGLTTLVPRAVTEECAPFSASHNDAFGSVVLSLPPDTATFAETLVHEFQHSKFGVVLTLVDLVDPTDDNNTPRLYAPWRDDPRPSTGLLHGMYSFLAVTAFYRDHALTATGVSRRVAQFEFAYRREQTELAAQVLLSDVNVSKLGRYFLTVTQDRLRAWSTEPLPEDIRVAAHRANVDHHLTWRLRHFRPPAGGVAELAQHWLRHSQMAITQTALPLRPANGSPTRQRLVLASIWLRQPELYERYRANPALATARIAGVTAADLALIGGESDTAAELYRQQILTQPEASAAWVGLALATGDKVLLNQPELVFAVHQEIRARSNMTPDPVQLARWLIRFASGQCRSLPVGSAAHHS